MRARAGGTETMSEAKKAREEDFNELVGESMKNCYLLGAWKEPRVDWVKLVRILKDSFDKGRKL